MRATWHVALVAVIVLAVLLGSATAQRGAGKNAGVLAPLKVGQQVNLRERAGGYEINAGPDVALGYKVLEVGPDYVVLEDITGITETRIPLYAIRAVKATRLP